MKLRLTKIAIFLAALIPLARLAWKALHGGLGANPIEVITHATGDWTLILVLTTLSITPLRRITHQYWLIGVRRMVGLFAFFYGTLHFLTYIWLDKFFDTHEMWKDIAKRPFITVGFSAFVLMIPLALTSTAWSIRRLGGKNWQRLHRLIYLTGILAVVHYTWLVKADLRKPIEYGVVLGILLLYRFLAWIFEERAQPAIPAPARSRAEVTKA
ncbi:MAG TPA: protein-methionine-sulfoxide reductase heme-binding subunit MsrQ [Terriglobales bacterium]|jgi:methionine sulfoxide reductase heme-binding subunit|nr:protein-methionine-sulfoxide reductase heme-binding subunit MsrQ [Terriglobales bacterium]